LRTNRFEVRGEEHFTTTMAAHGAALCGVWHEVLALAAWHYRDTGYHTLTSYSFDGELAARVARRLGIEAVRGSSSRGGLAALAQLERALELAKGVGLTVDGPRGPRHQVKVGIAMLAAKTGIPIVPCSFAASRSWRLNSWDRFIVPKPFGRVICAYGPPIAPPADSSPEAIEAVRSSVETSLKALDKGLLGESPSAS